MKRKEKYKDILELVKFNNKLTSLIITYLNTVSSLSRDNLMQELQKTANELNDWLEEEV